MIPSSAVQIEQLSKRFGEVIAIDRLSLVVPVGSFFALLGSNGAGKSTMVRILSTLIRPDQGQVQIVGLDLLRHPHAVRRVIGVVPDFSVLYDPLSPRENLARLASLRGIARSEARARMEELCEILGLQSWWSHPVGQLSHGTRKKVALAAALLHAPRLLLLDEPFEGIDPVAAGTIRTLLEALRARGVTIFMTSHVLPLVETLATDLAVMKQGRLLATTTVANVHQEARSLQEWFLELVGEAQVEPTLSWYAP